MAFYTLIFFGAVEREVVFLLVRKGLYSGCVGGLLMTLCGLLLSLLQRASELGLLHSMELRWAGSRDTPPLGFSFVLGGEESRFVTRLLGEHFLEVMALGPLLEAGERQRVFLVCIDNVWLSNGAGGEKCGEKDIELYLVASGGWISPAKTMSHPAK